MKAVIALGLVAGLCQAGIEVRNAAFTTCDEDSNAACAALNPGTAAHTDFTETQKLWESAKACAAANVKTDPTCLAGVSADVTITGDQLCTGTAGTGFFVTQDLGELEMSPFFILGTKVADANTGGSVNGKYLEKAAASICTGTEGKEGAFMISGDGETIVAPTAAPAYFVPGLPAQTKITIKVAAETEPTVKPKGASPLLVASTAAVLAAAALTLH